MGAKSRNKGAAGEREFVACAVEYGFRDAHRVAPMQAGHAEKPYPDVDGVGQLWIEVKRHKRVSVSGHFRDLYGEERPGFVPVLAYREDGESPGDFNLVMKASFFLPIYREHLERRRGETHTKKPEDEGLAG
jgi:hypothetical protein